MTDQAADSRRLRSKSPPASSEDIHLPPPTYLPIVVAAAITVALVGIVVNIVAFAAAIIVLVVGVLLWVRLVRREIAELPLDRG